MRLRRFRVFASFEPREPSVDLCACDVLSGRLVVCPGDEGIPTDLLATLLTFEVLVDRLAHEPMRRTAARIGELLQARLGREVQLQAGCGWGRHRVPLGVTEDHHSRSTARVQSRCGAACRPGGESGLDTNEREPICLPIRMETGFLYNMAYVKPQDVISPKAYWSLVEVLLDRGAGDCAYALGVWNGGRRIGFRWNGTADNPLGNPQSRGLPTWTMLDPKLHARIVEQLPSDKLLLARAFLDIKLILEGPQLKRDTHDLIFYDVFQRPPVIATIACEVMRGLLGRPDISDEDCQLLGSQHLRLISAIAITRFEKGEFSIHPGGRAKVIELQREELLSVQHQMSPHILNFASLCRFAG
jgi:hypothetical protein